MFNLTGQPGWMRLGFSPGWVGRSPSGLGPCAQFLMSGQWPAAQAGQPGGWAGIDPGSRIEFLKSQAVALEQTLAALKAQIQALEGQED